MSAFPLTKYFEGINATSPQNRRIKGAWLGNGSIIDHSSKRRHGAWNARSGIAYGPGPYSGARSFDLVPGAAANNWINLPAGDYIDMNVEFFYSVSCWVYCRSVGSFPAINMFTLNYASGNGSGFALNSGNIVFLNDDNTSGFGTSTAMPTNRWAHLVGVVNYTGGLDIKTYLDGVDISGSVSTSSWGVNANTIGRGFSSEEFDGMVSDLRIYHAALTPAEVNRMYGDPRDLYRKNRIIFLPEAAAGGGRVMSSLAGHGGLAGAGGLAGIGGGLAA